MALGKVLWAELHGQRIDAKDLESFAAKTPDHELPNILVHYESGDAIRPFRFSDTVLVSEKDGHLVLG